MTGKEALDELLKTLKHWQGRNTIFDKMQSDCILKELDELDKYKRAFEILKGLLSLEKDTILNTKAVFYTLYFTGDRPYESLTKEEYELLEELMKDENC